MSDRSNPLQVVLGGDAAPSADVDATEHGSCFKAFEQELDYLRRTLRRLGVRSTEVEDELHEVFLVLNNNWHKFDRTRPLKPYLFGIAFRVVAGRRRKSQREVTQQVEEFALAPGPGPEQALDQAQSRALVLAALNRVPLDRRAVLVMHDIDEVSMGDITKSLSIPLFTGYSRLRRAREEFEAAVRFLQHKGGANA